MGAGSRRKGAAAERELAAAFTDSGLSMSRNVEGSRGQPDGDLDNDLNLYIEARRRERLDIPGWMREVGQKKGKRIGLLATRRNREGWTIHLSLSDFIRLADCTGLGALAEATTENDAASLD